VGELEERFPKTASSYRLMGTEIKIQNELLSQSVDVSCFVIITMQFCMTSKDLPERLPK
jgi:hypothetical protein